MDHPSLGYSLLFSIAPRLSVDMLCACMKEIKRLDVLEIIRESDEEQGFSAPAQVFVSYQWDNKAEVLLIISQVRPYITYFFC